MNKIHCPKQTNKLESSLNLVTQTSTLLLNFTFEKQGSHRNKHDAALALQFIFTVGNHIRFLRKFSKN